jgi:voltage-gated potassium channel
MNPETLELEKNIPRKVGVTLILLLILIGIGTWMFYIQSGDLKVAANKAITLVTHIEIPSGGSALWSFVLSALGAILVLYIIIVVVQLVYEGRLKKNVKEVRMMANIKKLKNHYIICGGGRVGRSLAEELHIRKLPYVIIEENVDVVEELKHDDFLVIEGNALESDYLKLAGIERAKVLITCLNDDGNNMLQTIMAKDLNPKIKVVARVDLKMHVDKFISAGASEVVMPEIIGGKKMALVAATIGGDQDLEESVKKKE